MAQLRHDYPKFKSLNTEVLMVVPNGARLISQHIKANATPYPILSDKGAKVAAQYLINPRRAVVLSVFPPSVFLIDRLGKIQYSNYQSSYIAEPDNQEPLMVLAQLKVYKQAPEAIPA